MMSKREREKIAEILALIPGCRETSDALLRGVPLVELPDNERVTVESVYDTISRTAAGMDCDFDAVVENIISAFHSPIKILSADEIREKLRLLTKATKEPHVS